MFNKASIIQQEKIDAGKVKIQEKRFCREFFPPEKNQPHNDPADQSSAISLMRQKLFFSGYSNYTTFSILLDISNIHQQSRSFSKG